VVPQDSRMSLDAAASLVRYQPGVVLDRCRKRWISLASAFPPPGKLHRLKVDSLALRVARRFERAQSYVRIATPISGSRRTTGPKVPR
jgi:hypothetical protein